MRVLGVVGPSDSGKTSVVEEVVDRLDEEGPVATIKRITHEPDIDTEGKDTARHRSAGASSTYGISDSGEWFATGTSRSLDEILQALAPDFEYAIVEGYASAAIPKIVLGDYDVVGPVLMTAETGGAISIDDVLSTLEEYEQFETLESLVSKAKDSEGAECAGAIATFTGRVRRKDHPEDIPTKHLEFGRYDEGTDQRMEQIRSELTARDGVLEVFLHHRTGVIEAGEDIVFVVILARHREEAFRAVEDGVDRLKQEVPLFKKEVTVEGELWRHERE